MNREESGNRDCGVEVSPIAEEDNGVWKCRIFATDDNGESVEGNAEIVVVVAVPPQSVNLRYGTGGGPIHYRVIHLL